MAPAAQPALAKPPRYGRLPSPAAASRATPTTLATSATNTMSSPSTNTIVAMTSSQDIASPTARQAVDYTKPYLPPTSPSPPTMTTMTMTPNHTDTAVSASSHTQLAALLLCANKLDAARQESSQLQASCTILANSLSDPQRPYFRWATLRAAAERALYRAETLRTDTYREQLRLLELRALLHSRAEGLDLACNNCSATATALNALYDSVSPILDDHRKAVDALAKRRAEAMSLLSKIFPIVKVYNNNSSRNDQSKMIPPQPAFRIRGIPLSDANRLPEVILAAVSSSNTSSSTNDPNVVSSSGGGGVPGDIDIITEDARTVAAALGYVAHAVSLIAGYLNVPLRYPIIVSSSRSTVFDAVDPSFRSVLPLTISDYLSFPTGSQHQKKLMSALHSSKLTSMRPSPSQQSMTTSMTPGVSRSPSQHLDDDPSSVPITGRPSINENGIPKIGVRNNHDDDNDQQVTDSPNDKINSRRQSVHKLMETVSKPSLLQGIAMRIGLLRSNTSGANGITTGAVGSGTPGSGVNLSKSNEYPLFWSGNKSDRIRFEYGVFLLNKDIEQLMNMSRLPLNDLRCTLENLDSLLQHLNDPLAPVERLTFDSPSFDISPKNYQTH